MLTIWIGDNEGKIKEMLIEMLAKAGNTKLDIVKQENVIRIMEKDEIKNTVSLEDKVIELEESLYNVKKGSLYKAVLDVIEKPLIEYVLERTEGNQLKAARILGMNRNTIRARIKKLGINVSRWKVI